MKNSQVKGFILLELVVSFVLIGIITSLIISFFFQIEKINKKIEFEHNLTNTFNNIYFHVINNHNLYNNKSVYLLDDNGLLNSDLILDLTFDYRNYPNRIEIDVNKLIYEYSFSVYVSNEPFSLPIYNDIKCLKVYIHE